MNRLLSRSKVIKSLITLKRKLVYFRENTNCLRVLPYNPDVLSVNMANEIIPTFVGNTKNKRFTISFEFIPSDRNY